MTEQTVPCRSTQHCATHGFCHRCAPSLHKATGHLIKAIDVAGIEYSASGRVYAALAATVRDAARQAAGQATTIEQCACGHERNGHGLDFTDRCLNCLCKAYNPAVEEAACALPKFMGCECNHLTGCQHPAPAVEETP